MFLGSMGTYKCVQFIEIVNIIVYIFIEGRSRMVAERGDIQMFSIYQNPKFPEYFLSFCCESNGKRRCINVGIWG